MAITYSEGYAKFRQWAIRFLLFITIVPALGVALWTWAALKFTYASGERSGYVQKLSKKGWVCKTWEGELAMANLPGSLPQIFSFTVRNDGVAHQLEKTMGRRVAIHYEQHRGIPFSCFGDTEYFITDIMVPEDASDGNPSPGAVAGPPSSAVHK